MLSIADLKAILAGRQEILHAPAEDPGSRLSPEPEDVQGHYEGLLLKKAIMVFHAGQWKHGHIVAIVESPYLPDKNDWMALWYADQGFALDYIPVELAWQVVSE